MPEVPCESDGQRRRGTADVQGTAASFADLLLPVRPGLRLLLVSGALTPATSLSSCAACIRLAFLSRRRCSKALCRLAGSAPT